MGSYTNPHTLSRYRLAHQSGDQWRITKSTTDRAGNIRLYHLWGQSDGDPSSHEWISLPIGIDLLIRGTVQRHHRVIGDPDQAFVSVCLTDMDRTFDFICAGIKESMKRYERGAPGFRAQSPMLRQEKDRWIQAALDAPLAFARWWREMGYQANPEPKWLTESLEIIDKNARENRQITVHPESVREVRRAVG